MLKTVHFEIETITPMFISGPDQGKAELRAPSIKGLLRFWWRAMHPISSMDILKQKESSIFGSGGENDSGGSSFSIRLVYNTVPTAKEKFPKQNIIVASKGKTFPVNILEYLAYGTYKYEGKEKGNVFLREWIKPGTKFHIDMTFFEETYIDEVLESMRVFSLFGGIGSRSRNGFGGFSILNDDEAFGSLSFIGSSKDAYNRNSIVSLVRKIENQPYTSFTQRTKLFRSKTPHVTWDSALAEIGKIYRSARESLERRHVYEKRQYVGAPIIADKKDKSFLDRHAKPYFMRVAREGTQYSSYILYLPSLYAQGLDKDQFGSTIDHDVVDERFSEICAEVNNYLSQNMETIL